MDELTMSTLSQKKCSNKDCTDPVKPLGEFPKNKTSKDGRSHWCKDCHKNYRKAKKVAAVMYEDNELTGAQDINWKLN